MCVCVRERETETETETWNVSLIESWKEIIWGTDYAMHSFFKKCFSKFFARTDLVKILILQKKRCGLEAISMFPKMWDRC